MDLRIPLIFAILIVAKGDIEDEAVASPDSNAQSYVPLVEIHPPLVPLPHHGIYPPGFSHPVLPHHVGIFQQSQFQHHGDHGKEVKEVKQHTHKHHDGKGKQLKQVTKVKKTYNDGHGDFHAKTQKLYSEGQIVHPKTESIFKDDHVHLKEHVIEEAHGQYLPFGFHGGHGQQFGHAFGLPYPYHLPHGYGLHGFGHPYFGHSAGHHGLIGHHGAFGSGYFPYGGHGLAHDVVEHTEVHKRGHGGSSGARDIGHVALNHLGHIEYAVKPAEKHVEHKIESVTGHIGHGVGHGHIGHGVGHGHIGPVFGHHLSPLGHGFGHIPGHIGHGIGHHIPGPIPHGAGPIGSLGPRPGPYLHGLPPPLGHGIGPGLP